MQTTTLSPFTHYLQAKKSLDDRSLNRHVYGLLARNLAKIPADSPLRVLELGAGCGTMVTRLIEWGLLRSARYTALDQRDDFIENTRAYLTEWSQKWDYELDRSHPDHLTLERAQNLIHLLLIRQSLAEYVQTAAATTGAQQPDVLIAHAFLDLVDLPATLPALIELVRPGGFLYLTLNFDGQTIFEPPYEPRLQTRILERYHASMDGRRINGRPSGDSHTGRHLLHELIETGLPVLAAGSSDWVVYPGPEGYTTDELVVIHTVLDTIAENVAVGAGLGAEDLQRWLENRRSLASAGRLVYIAHQIDVLVQKPLQS